MAVRAITTVRQAEELASAWAQLHVEAHGTPFTHPAWCIAWMKAFPHSKARILVDKDPLGQPRLVLPLAAGRRSGRWSSLGHPLVDFGAPLIRPGTDVPAAILRTLSAAPGWRSVHLVGLPAAVANALLSAPDAAGLVAHARPGDDCPWIDIPSYAEWEGALSTSRRRRVRAVIRESQRLGCTMHHLTDPASTLAGLRRFETLRLQSWWQSSRWHELPKQARGVEHGRLFSGIAIREAGRLITVAELRYGSRVLASAVLLWSATGVLVAVVATDKRLGSAVSPGLALDIKIVELAARRGIRRIDFGRGDEPYKFSLGARSFPTVDVILTRRTRWTTRLPGGRRT